MSFGISLKKNLRAEMPNEKLKQQGLGLKLSQYEQH